MKRLVIAGLWLYAFWYLGSMVSLVLGVPDLPGPALGLTAGIMVWSDPRGSIWRHRGTRRASEIHTADSSGRVAA